MAFLMNVAFDNTVRLQRRTYLFEYKGFRFKLVQDDPRRYHDHLLTILSDYHSEERTRAFAAASEFVSALAWQSGAAMTVWDSGGAGWPDHRPLRSARPTIFGFPRVPNHGYTIGGGLISIPHVQTIEQRVALSLFREARASNSRYLSFLFLWQSMEVLGTKPHAFIKDVMENHRHQVPLEDSWFDRLPLSGRTIGDYLEDDCRHAIAHIKRWPGKKRLDLDSWDEHLRFAISVEVVEALSQTYIRHRLGMSEELTLVRPRSGGFPRFADRATLAKGRYEIAYPSRPLRLRAARIRVSKLPSRRYY
jgi:hypothetical protein